MTPVVALLLLLAVVVVLFFLAVGCAAMLSLDNAALRVALRAEQSRYARHVLLTAGRMGDCGR